MGSLLDLGFASRAPGSPGRTSVARPLFCSFALDSGLPWISESCHGPQPVRTSLVRRCGGRTSLSVMTLLVLKDGDQSYSTDDVQLATNRLLGEEQEGEPHLLSWASHECPVTGDLLWEGYAPTSLLEWGTVILPQTHSMGRHPSGVPLGQPWPSSFEMSQLVFQMLPFFPLYFLFLFFCPDVASFGSLKELSMVPDLFRTRTQHPR